MSVLGFATLAAATVINGAWDAAAALGSIGAFQGIRTMLDGAAAMATLHQAARAAGLTRDR